MDSQEDNKSVANELESKIIQQIEYYFSDINLSRDKFMKEMLTKEEGWIPFDTLLTFNRLKSLSEDKSVIVNALKKSVSKLLEMSECETKIRRPLDRPLPEFDEKYTQDLNERTLHIKGFPADTKLDDVMDFCRELGTVENIEMRRHFKTKKFKGCIFVTFVNKEDAQKAIDDSELKYKDNNLLRENKVNYFIRKKEFSDKKHSKRNSKNNNSVKSEDKAIKEEEDAEEGDDEGDTEKSEVAVNVVKYEAAVLKLKGLDEKTKFGDIKDLFQKYGNVAYVEDVKQNESFVRFNDNNGAKNALEKVKSAQNSESDEVKVEISGKEVVLELLTGEEELQYWTEFEKKRTENNRKRSQKKKEFYSKGRKGKNMWQRGRKRGYQGDRGGRNDRGSGDRNGKRVKTEDSD